MSLLTRQKSRTETAVDKTSTGDVAAGPGRPRRHAPIDPNARSCCCPSEPVAQVILTPSHEPGVTRDQPAEVDILLCAHHLRQSAKALETCAASVFDRRGNPLDELATVFIGNH